MGSLDDIPKVATKPLDAQIIQDVFHYAVRRDSRQANRYQKSRSGAPPPSPSASLGLHGLSFIYRVSASPSARVVFVVQELRLLRGSIVYLHDFCHLGPLIISVMLIGIICRFHKLVS